MKRLAILLALVAGMAGPHAQVGPTVSSLSEDQVISGFQTRAIYLNGSDRPMGARFTHVRSGFTLDVVEIESVPQAFVWVTTYPGSDMGEPHTQEHLLLGKGMTGIAVASREPMSLASSTAFTQQWRTCYSFNTAAGLDVFHDEFERRLDALLHPDYSDEEIRREVRNFGVTENPADHTLGLEEKGTVYNEMVSSTDQPGRRIYDATKRLLYGAGHPLQFNAGGSPEALRSLTPADIRRFHAAHYFLANMGAIVSVPRGEPLAETLSRLDAILTRVEPERPSMPIASEADLPAPQPAPAGTIRYVAFPHGNDQQPGPVYLVWPAERTMSLTERTLLELFLGTFAGDATTNLYKRLIDSKTREIPLGAQSVFASTLRDQGVPVIVGFGDMPVAKMNDVDLTDLRSRVIDELTRVAGWDPNSDALGEFNERVRSRVLETRRELARFVNSPPGFGLRSTGAGWITQLYDLEAFGGFSRSLTWKPVLADIETLLAEPGNLWASRLTTWNLLSSQPSIVAARPDTELAGRQLEARAARVADEIARLRVQYGESTDQAALARYRADYDAASVAIEEAASRVTPPRFIDRPPLTLDDQLDYRASELPGGVPLVSSTFASMTGATVGIALQLDAVPPDRLVYLSALPTLLTNIGVIENGQPVSYEDMRERMRREILGLSAGFTTTASTERVELTMRAAGNDVDEATRALGWMRLALFHPDFRLENLPRIRDVLDQLVTRLRRTPQTAEENWVRPVAVAYWKQHNPLFLTATSFMTQTHQVQRLRWMLTDASTADRAAAVETLEELATREGTRDQLKAMLAPLATGANAALAAVARDLDATLAEIPDTSLPSDWRRLCTEAAADVAITPDQTLARLDEVGRSLLKTGAARLFAVGAASTHDALAAPIAGVVGDLDRAPLVPAGYRDERIVDDNLRDRGGPASPVFVGLLNPSSQSGVFVNSAAGTSMDETDRDALLDYLAAVVYAGGGSHSVFTRTISAGLAYSNGLNASPVTGRVTYYAERTPDLAQTLQFVVDYLKSATIDPALVEYAVAQAFRGTRAANSYESRAEDIAEDLANGMTPAVVTRFRTDILELRALGPGLLDELASRKDTLPSRVLPGLAAPSDVEADAVTFVIGPERQFASWERYLTSVEGHDTRVERLYPRDFWLP